MKANQDWWEPPAHATAAYKTVRNRELMMSDDITCFLLWHSLLPLELSVGLQGSSYLWLVGEVCNLSTLPKKFVTVSAKRSKNMLRQTSNDCSWPQSRSKFCLTTWWLFLGTEHNVIWPLKKLRCYMAIGRFAERNEVQFWRLHHRRGETTVTAQCRQCQAKKAGRT